MGYFIELHDSELTHLPYEDRVRLIAKENIISVAPDYDMTKITFKSGSVINVIKAYESYSSIKKLLMNDNCEEDDLK